MIPFAISFEIDCQTFTLMRYASCVTHAVMLADHAIRERWPDAGVQLLVIIPINPSHN